MKRLCVLPLAFLILALVCRAQALSDERDSRFDASRLDSMIIYPVDALVAGREGSVLMRVRINADGSAGKIEWQQENDTLLAGAAFRALSNYRFRPSGDDTDQESGWIYIPIHFSLEPSRPARDAKGRSVINVTPDIRQAGNAPRLNVQTLRAQLAGRQSDTVAPVLSAAALREHFYYPDMARFRHLEGTVLVHVLVDRMGKATSAYALLSDNGIFDAPAVEAVSRSTFQPGSIQGRSSILWTVVPVRYSLNQ